MGNWERDRLLSPTSYAAVRLLAGLAWLWLLVALPFLTNASCGLYPCILLVFTWLALAVAWVCLPVFEPAIVFRSPRGRRLWLSVCLAGGLGVLLAFTDLGLTARVALGERWLRAYAQSLNSGTRQIIHQPHTVGLFRVDETEACDGAVLLFTSPSDQDGKGIAYLPPEADVPSHVRLVSHLFGPWYRFKQKF
jgi:hypothetical protein